jgi:hypothetical protein
MGDEDTRASYDAVAETYATLFGDELAGKPLDRALLAALAETVTGPVAERGGVRGDLIHQSR